MIKKLLLSTALTLGLSTASNATVVSFCGPDNGTGCEQPGEQKIFLNEGHDQTTITGNVGANNSGPLVVITADSGSFDTFLDSGGGFANIDASHGFKAFNGVTITIPGYTFTDMVFSVQMNRQGGHKGDSELDTFRIGPFNRVGLIETLIGLLKDEQASPDADFQYAAYATGGVLDELTLDAAGPPLSGGFFEIKHLQVSGLEPLVVSAPEPSTWALFGIGFASVGVLALRRRRGMSVA